MTPSDDPASITDPATTGVGAKAAAATTAGNVGLPDTDKVNVTFEVTDTAGNVIPGATIDANSATGIPADPAILTAAPNADGLSVDVTAVGPDAAGELVTFNATVGAVPVSTTLTFDVTAGTAVGIVAVAGTPTPK